MLLSWFPVTGDPGEELHKTLKPNKAVPGPDTKSRKFPRCPQASLFRKEAQAFLFSASSESVELN